MVKLFACAVALALSLGNAQAALIELTIPPPPARGQSVEAAPGARPPQPAAFVVHQMSTVPEPQVFAMMLLGLCLIGFRVSRITDEKFK